MSEFTWPNDDELPTKGTGDYKKFTEGKYTVVVEDAALSLTDEPPVISYTFKVIDGEMSNYKLWKKSKLDDKGKKWAAGDFKNMMLDRPKSYEHLASQLAGMIGRPLEVYVKPTPSKMDPNKIYNNTYINGLVNHAPQSENNTPAFDQDEEIPF